MMVKKGKKLQTLLKIQKENTPLFVSYLKKLGYTKELLRSYVKSGWLKRIDKGVYIYSHNKMTIEGLIFALQEQLSLKIYPAGKTALELVGIRQYVLKKEQKFTVFCYNTPNNVPKMVKENKNLDIKFTKLFNKELLGLTELKGQLPLKISSRERAILETVFMVKDENDFREAYELVELLYDLREDLIQKLLMTCKSIKTKRLFLFLSKSINHDWYKSLDLSKINLGKGPRQIIKNGLYNKEFMITIPNDFYEY